LDSPILTCFKIFKVEEVKNWRLDKLIFKRNFKWEIFHPFDDDKPKITVTLEWCFLLDGKTPHGFASLSYKDPEYDWKSFSGVGVFKEGVLHGGPAVFINGDGWVRSFSQMVDGRASGWGTLHYREGCEMNTNTKKTETDVSGMLGYAG
jgi:hypothetical protein